MKPIAVVAFVASAAACCVASADLIVLEPIQTGGFYDSSATPDNLPAFQNYFVGYGTSPGGMRTPERRSFFYFELPPIEGEIIAATLTLKLPFGGLVFGKGPGDPAMGPILDDMAETFLLGVTPLPHDVITSTTLTPAEIDGAFETFNDAPVSVPLTFMMGGPPPPPDGMIDIPLTDLGLAHLAAAAGDEIILTGWMPTWTEDFRIVPGSMPPMLLEGSELIFGFTDILAPDFPDPFLTIMTSVVPEASSLMLLTAVSAAAAGMRARRHFR